MYPTMEVRWFLRGNAPAETCQWFERGAIAPTEEGLREDWYLDSTASSLGIKLRQTHLEIKQRLRNDGVHQFAQDVRGQVEKWLKWEFPLDSANCDLPNLSQSDRFWILIKKERRSRHYAITADGVEPIEATAQVTQGGTLELTELQVGEHRWYSLGLEAFGDIDRVEQNLAAMIAPVSTDANLILKATDSFGYPQWLQQVLR